MRTLINFIDIETTGLNVEEHRIIEFCGKQFDLQSKKLVRSVIQRFNPMRTIDAKALKTHGITLAELANEPLWDTHAHEAAEMITEADHNVAHNGDYFDFPFISRECARVSIPLVIKGSFDTMTGGRFATPYGKNPTLGELARCLGIPYDPALAHAAEYDVDIMAECFFEAHRLNWFNLK